MKCPDKPLRFFYLKALRSSSLRNSALFLLCKRKPKSSPCRKLQQYKIMGDKSPKSKNKDSKQKQGKADASNKAKQKSISDKQSANIGSTPKKKK